MFLGLQEEESCVHAKVQRSPRNRGGVRGESPARLFGWTDVSPGWYFELWIVYLQSSGLQACAPISSLCGTGAGPQGLVCARRALSPLNHAGARILRVHFQPSSFLVNAGLANTESWIRTTKALPKSEQADAGCDSSLFPWHTMHSIKQQLLQVYLFLERTAWVFFFFFFQRQLPSVLQLLWKPV